MSTKEKTKQKMTINDFKNAILSDYRLINECREASLLGRRDVLSGKGSFGHKVMKVDTVHGDITLVKEPLFRGLASTIMALVDLDHVSYRPLVGNGMNRDTSITTNVQQADEDLRKDMILTEAGLEISLPETHALFNIEGA